jgi:hypothetical protein
MSLAGLLLVGLSVAGAVLILGLLADGEGLWRLGLVLLGQIAMMAALGVGLMVLALQMASGSRVARGVSFVLLLAVTAGLAFGADRGLPALLVIAGCLVTLGLLALAPNVNAFFRGSPAHGTEALSVVVARTLIAIWAGTAILMGLVYLPLAGLNWRLTALGMALIALGVVSLIGNSRLAAGSSSARILLTIGAAGYVLLLLTLGQWQPTLIVPLSLIGGVLGFLWLPADAKAHFAGPGPVRPGAIAPPLPSATQPTTAGPVASAPSGAGAASPAARPALLPHQPSSGEAGLRGAPPFRVPPATAPPMEPAASRGRKTLPLLIAGVVGAALLGAFALVAYFFIFNSEDAASADPEVAIGSGRDGPEGSSTAPTTDRDAVFNSAVSGSAAVWSGEVTFPATGNRYDLAMRLTAGPGGSLSGQVRMTNRETLRSGSWYVQGDDDGDQLVLDVGRWIAQPNAEWSRDGFRLSQTSDGGLRGRSLPESLDGNAGDVRLSLVVASVADADAVADDWRVALVVPEDDAHVILEGIRVRDLPRREELAGSWVPQLSSGCTGLQTSLGPITSSALLTRSARAAQNYDAITVTWQDVGTSTPDACPASTMWLVLVPEPSAEAAGALAWCSRAGLSSDDCAARYLVGRGETGTRVEYQP